MPQQQKSMTGQRKFALKVCAVAAGVVFPGMAHAQSSVHVYGIVDGGLIYTSKHSPALGLPNEGRQVSFTDSGLSPSIFGMQGIGDMGGGLGAEFKLESGFNVANGGYNNSNGNFFGRQAYVGLTSRWGKVDAGLQFSPFFLATYDLDPRGLSQTGSSQIMYLDNVIATGILTPNAVSYTSPRVDGFQASALLSLGGVAGDFKRMAGSTRAA
ncbi:MULTISPECIES: porin [Paraburkholderia]|uniref:porin n=1 Tax=Paraburkholderia TaxID=1822464 RepID=UPI0028A9380F|nr:porin [Paraburkholderia podalyriae]